VKKKERRKGEMPLDPVKKTAIGEVIDALLGMQAPRGKRLLCGMFMDLVDRVDWPHYYEVNFWFGASFVYPLHPLFCFLFFIFTLMYFFGPFFFDQVIPEPRCINNIKGGLEKGRYKEPSDVYTDLSLVFWNALFYNEPGSQIALDAETLKVGPGFLFFFTNMLILFLLFGKKALEVEWEKKGVLGSPPRTSPPPSSAQKVHGVVDQPSQAVAPNKPPPPSSSLQTSSQKVHGVMDQPLQQHPVKMKSVVQPLPQTSVQFQPVATTTATTAITTTTTTTTTPMPKAMTPVPLMSKMPRSTPGPSTNTTASTKPVPIQPKSAQKQTTPDAEIDIMAEDDVAGEEVVTERDPESEEIVRQLEKGLPRWPGFGDQGWMKEGTSVYIQSSTSSSYLLTFFPLGGWGISIKCLNLYRLSRTTKTSRTFVLLFRLSFLGCKRLFSGNKPSVSLEAIPEESTIPYLSYTTRLSLKLIEVRRSFSRLITFIISIVKLIGTSTRQKI